MMLKLSNISYERLSGKFNFKVFLTVDVSISEVYLRQQAYHILSFCPHNALGCGLAGEICMKKSV